MKNKNDTGDPDRKGDSEGGATDVPASATGMFERPPAPPKHEEFDDLSALRPAVEAASSAGEKTSPGEFTQLFEAITPNVRATPLEASKAAASPAPTPSSVSSAQKTAADPKVGEFTRIFMRVPKEPDPGAGSTVPAAAVSPKAADIPPAAGKATGEFTRLMRATEATKPSPHGGAAAATPGPASAPVRGISAPGANDAVSGTAGVTELFVTPTHRPSTPPAAPTAPLNAPQPARQSMPQPVPQTAPVGGRSAPPSDRGWVSDLGTHREEPSVGEFTQLFRALDSSRETSGQAPGMEAPRGAAPQTPQTGKFSDAGGGDFTQLMQSLSHERQVEGRPAAQAQTPMPAATPTTGTWPEPMTVRAAATDDSASFTRIISSSAAREEAARGTKSAADAPPAKAGASAPPAAPMAGMPQPLQAPIPRVPAFGQPPAAPAPPPPVLPKAAPVSKLQSYLPLLLIVNAFALAVLILLVIIALHRH